MPDKWGRPWGDLKVPSEADELLDSIAELTYERDQLRQQVADLQFEVLELKTINHTLMTNNPLRQQALKDHGTR